MLLYLSGYCSNRLSVLFVLCLCLLELAAAWALPFSSSRSYNEEEEADRWLASPAQVTHRDLNPKLLKAPSKSQDVKDRILILTPLKDAASHLPHHFALLANLSYPHDLIDLGFIVGDSTDDTFAVLNKELNKLVENRALSPFNSCTIVRKDLGDIRSQEVASRHGFQAQVKRRKKLAIVRNALLKETLKDEHVWVYWRDVDLAESPAGILEDFIAHEKDIIVPSEFCKCRSSLFGLTLVDVWFKRQQKGSMLEGGCKSSVNNCDL